MLGDHGRSWLRDLARAVIRGSMKASSALAASASGRSLTAIAESTRSLRGASEDKMRHSGSRRYSARTHSQRAQQLAGSSAPRRRPVARRRAIQRAVPCGTQP